MLKSFYELTIQGWCGVALVTILAAIAFGLAQWEPIAAIPLGPLTLAILIGMGIGNTIYHHLPSAWLAGVKVVQQKFLRLGIILYGLQITLQDIVAVGLSGLLIDIFMVLSVFIIGTWCGMRWLKLDRDTAMLTSVGSAICGAAAVLATEPVLRAENHKAALAVTTVVLFGTIAMFLYPFLFYYAGLDPQAFGIYIGATVHEVAQVVAAGEAINLEVATTAVIVKLTRVMLLAPFLLGLSFYLAKTSVNSSRTSVIIPWFAVGFVLVSVINSINIIPKNIISVLMDIDIFLLTMAMLALGIDTNLKKFKTIGWRPVILAGGLFIYLLSSGYLLMRII